MMVLAVVRIVIANYDKQLAVGWLSSFLPVSVKNCNN